MSRPALAEIAQACLITRGLRDQRKELQGFPAGLTRQEAVVVERDHRQRSGRTRSAAA